jgi:hypothetical protein
MVRTVDDDRTEDLEAVSSADERPTGRADDSAAEPDTCSCRRCRELARDEMWVRWA